MGNLDRWRGGILMVERMCQYKKCGKIFYTNWGEIRKGGGKFCCRDHYRLHSYTLEAIKDRFLRLVAVKSEEECWLWLGGTTSRGYGVFGFRKKGVDFHNVLAHRFSYRAFVGKIPKGLQVCHDCPTGDNPSCVNPNHLWIGTQEDNMQDMLNKGRGKQVGVQRDSHVKTKIFTKDIDKVLKLRDEGYSGPAAGRICGVHSSTIYRIWNLYV